MAMYQLDLSELLEAVKAADVDDRVRTAAQSVYQTLIAAEAEGVIDIGPEEHAEGGAALPNRPRAR